MDVLLKLASHLHEQLEELSEVQATLRSEIDQPYGWMSSNIDHLFDLRRDKMMRISRFMSNDAVSSFIDNYRARDIQEDWERTCVSTLELARAACMGLLDGANGTEDANLSEMVDDATGLCACVCMCLRTASQTV